jgi:DNA-binding transcriptional ArsR family regulator
MPVAEDELSRTFAALADPTRRAILERLAAGEATVAELAAPFRITQQAVSRHLRVLEHAHLITRSRSAQSRPSALDTARLEQTADWIEHHRRLWSDRYDRLDEHLAALRGPVRAPAETSSKKGIAP